MFKTHLILFYIAFLAFPAAGAGQHAPEKVVVQTDRELYIAGEQLYFKLLILGEKDSEPALSNVCYLLLRDSKNTFNRIFLKTSPDNAGYGSIYLPDTLKTGYYEIVAFTSYMKNFGEEAYFRKQIVVVNRFDEWLSNLFPKEDETREPGNASVLTGSGQVKIELQKDSFSCREKIVCRVDFDSRYKALGLSVKEINLYSANPVIKKGEISSFITENLEFAPEREGIFLTGKISDGNSKPVPNECLFLSTPDSVANLIYTFSDTNGKFSFYLNDYYTGKQLIIKPRNNNGNIVIAVDDKFSLKNAFEPVSFGITRELRTLIQESQNIVRIQKAYGINRLRVKSGNISRLGLSHAYRQAGSIVLPSEYVSLPDFKQISENLIPGSRLKTDGKNYPVYLLNKSNNYFFQQPAAVFLDGVYVYGLKQAMNLNSEAIARIEICYNQRIKGAIDFPGILSIQTVGKIKDFSFDEGSCIVNIPDFSGKALYAAPNYNFSPVSDPVPDLRQLIYWSPVVEKQHEFFSSDWNSDYVIEVELVNQSGEIEIFRKTFKVGK